MRTLTILALITAALSFSTSDAKAERYWPWCARYDAWTIVCGFATFQQCQATVSGVGGLCQRNVMGPPVADVSAPRKRKHRRRH
ncbi:MAG: DUF3551 domain-containing protein [Rhodoplanes sp.]